MTQIIAGTATFSSQTNRDAALTRVNTALGAFAYSNIATTLTPVGGILTPSTTTITISISIGDEWDGAAVAKAIYDAWIASNRHTTGYLSLSRF